MFRTDSSQMIEGVTVYPDSDDWWKYYLLPSQPTFRRNAQGDPNFSFFKYRFPVNRPDGKVGGGYVLFDVSFTVPKLTRDKVIAKLQQQVNTEAARRNEDPRDVVIGSMRYTDGKCNLIIAEADGTLVQKVQNQGKPSLYGENTATFGVELTAEGATFFEQAMQGRGPSIGIEYELTTFAKLPLIEGEGRFHAFAFYSFYQEVDTDWSFWGEDERTEKIREFAIDSESIDVHTSFPAQTPPEVEQQIRSFVLDTTAAAAERKIIEAISPVPDDQRDLPDGIEDMTVDISSTKISNFTLRFTEDRAVEWTIYPNGLLPSFASLTDASGSPYNWDDFATTVDLHDPAFQKMRVDVRANADFANLPIHSLEVKLDYAGSRMTSLEQGAVDGEIVLSNPDEIGKFASFIVEGEPEYQYSYQINYTNQSRIFQSETFSTNEGNLTIGVDRLGILDVEFMVGDINWRDINSALVVFKYQDTGVPAFERQFTLDPNNTSHRITEVIFEPVRKNYKYQIKYFLADGTEVLSDVLESRSPTVFINDMFAATRTISVNGVGDFQSKIANVFADLVYSDTANNHHAENAVVLNAGSPMNRWVLPVISATEGVLTYSGTVVFKDGTSDVIPPTVAESDTILLPKPADAFLEVMVIPDLIDWTAMRLVRVSLSYSDPESGMPDTQNYIFSATSADMQTWRVPLKDAAANNYTYTVTYFPTTGTPIVDGPHTTADQTVILDPMLVA